MYFMTTSFIFKVSHLAQNSRSIKKVSDRLSNTGLQMTTIIYAPASYVPD